MIKPTAPATDSPRFTRLRLRNWRNFRNVEIALGSRVFVVGPNAAGKTNLLDAFRFLRDIAAPGGSLVGAIGSRRGLKHIRSLHAKAEGGISVEVSMHTEGSDEEWTYELGLTGTETGSKPIRIAREVVRHGDRVVLSRTEPDDVDDDPRLRMETQLETASQNRSFRPLADALAATTHVHVVPQVARATSDAEEFARRDAPGSDFIARLARAGKGEKSRTLKRIERLLKIAVPRFSALKIERDTEGRPHLAANYSHWRKRGGWQNEQEFSDGTLRLIGLLWAIDQGTAPLLLEEPELSLHRDVVRQLPRLFARAAHRTGRQVIVTTHSEDMLQDSGIDASEIVVLIPGEHGTEALVGSASDQIRRHVAAGIPLGRAVTTLTKPKDIEQLSLFPEISS